VADHNAFNPEIGSQATFDRMAASLAERGLGAILDIVPNHMGVAGDANPWWMDMLENGPSSPRASFFDIEWSPPKVELRNKVLLPVLPDQYGRVLESGQLQLELADGASSDCAGARRPSPDTYPRILTCRPEELSAGWGRRAHSRNSRALSPARPSARPERRRRGAHRRAAEGEEV
jgi:(1->4)-alpha-D-glucan 1-alpha-D-glucosylmutase